jgi:hypothetical protein
MKVFLHYNESKEASLHKTLKITLPKSWKNGPTSKLLDQFVETYNSSEKGSKNALHASELHLATKCVKDEKEGDALTFEPLASDAITIEVIDDREDVYICSGPSRTLSDIEHEKKEEIERKKAELANTAACVHFGCKNRFSRGGPYPECSYHAGPPVFHETGKLVHVEQQSNDDVSCRAVYSILDLFYKKIAKFWSCCPQKKAYDWEDFQNIKGCQTGTCTDVKDESTTKQFLGGCDLRESMGEAQKLKTIHDFNAAQASGSDAAPVLERLRSVFSDIGIENELFDQVVNSIKEKFESGDDGETLSATAEELGKKLKSAMKNIAVQQLRIK